MARLQIIRGDRAGIGSIDDGVNPVGYPLLGEPAYIEDEERIAMGKGLGSVPVDMAKKSEVGDITTLTTTAKSSAVAAINELDTDVDLNTSDRHGVNDANTTHYTIAELVATGGSSDKVDWSHIQNAPSFGSDQWLPSVADNTAKDAIVGMSTGDCVLVRDDGDGKAAQYEYNGSAWAKIADVDWAPYSDAEIKTAYENNADTNEYNDASKTIVDATGFTGDSGAGGAKGLVPAPGAGDAAANKYLKADATWAVVDSSPTTTAGDIIKRGVSADERLAIGTNGYVLTVVAGVPTWAVAGGGGGGGVNVETYDSDSVSNVDADDGDTIIINFNDTSTITVTLPAAAGNERVSVKSIGAAGGTLTIVRNSTPGTDNIYEDETDTGVSGIAVSLGNSYTLEASLGAWYSL